MIWVNGKFRKLTWFTLFFVSVTLIFTIHFLSEKYPIKEGEIASVTVKATRTITLIDEQKTEEQKKMAEESIQEVYVLDKSILNEMDEELRGFYVNFTALIFNNNLNSKDKVRILRRDFNLSEVAANIFLAVEKSTIKALESESINLLKNNWHNGVKETEVEAKKEKIFSQIELLNYNAPYRELIKASFLHLNLRPDYYYDHEATLKARKEAAKNVVPVLVTIREGQKIVGEGEVVTAEQIVFLRALGYQGASSAFTTLIGVVLFLFLLTMLTILFLKNYRREIYRNDNKMILLTLLILIILLVAKLISVVKISPKLEVAELVGYLIPISAGSMLIAILIETKLAIYLTIIFGILVGVLTGNSLPYAIAAFIGGASGVYTISKFKQRFDWVKAGLFVAGANVFCIFSLGLMYESPWQIVATGASLGAVNGFLSAILAYGSLPFFESGFKITTHVRLLELANPTQPLLKRLLFEAPGTYHHSILVGNLAEAAADAVGADSLLVRVGAYYHDIGKLKRPYFFIENQLGGDNPHDKLTPPLSTLIITSHIKDGLELARQEGIPPVILDLIAEHHGTSLVSYFYHKALEMGNADNIKEDDYRYNAPKPQSKEAAIIMLADSVEAAVRSLSAVTTGKIEGMIRKIIKEKLQDGQLDESDLTFKDLDSIANAFTHILNGIFHSRIEYPESVLKAMEGGSLNDGNTNRQSTEDGESNSTAKEDSPDRTVQDG